MINTNQNILFLATILALCVISFMHVFLFPIYGGITTDLGLHKRNSKTYREFEQSLCLANLKWIGKGRLCRSTGTNGCPQDGIVTVIQGGRLGNQMWEYASVWAIARRTGLEPYIPRCIKTKLEHIFDSTMTVPSLDEIGHCQVNLDRFVTSLEMWNYTNQSIVLPRYISQADVVLTWVQDIRQEFTFKKTLLTRRDQILKQALQATIGTKKNMTRRILTTLKPVYVGVHVRRTDYIGYLWRKHGRRPAPPRYYLNAMCQFDRRYDTPSTPVVHVIISDDPSWCKRMLIHRSVKRQLQVQPANTVTNKLNRAISNVYVVTTSIVGLDLAVLAACNHSIMDYGTFGVWAAILAGGETVYYNLSMHLSARVGELMPKWWAMS